MKIRVYVPVFADANAVDEKGFVEMEPGSTLGDLMGKLRLPFKLLAASFCVVNYEKSGIKRVLCDGDVVSFFSILAGG